MKKAYVCGVSFQHEIGECNDIHYYDSLEELMAKGQCWEECGVVEIEFDGPNYPEEPEDIKSHKWVVEQDLFNKVRKKEDDENK